MGKIVKYHQPCLICHSSDARQIYEDGSSYCFSCSRYFNNKGKEGEMPTPKMFQPVLLEEISKYKSAALKDRRISKEVMEFFEVKVSFNEDGFIDTHYYPYENGFKIRKLPKTFNWVGSSGGVFGKKQFNGVNKKLIITEGEIDALSIAQASWDKYQKIYPVVALPSANATKELLKIRDWIREFQEVVLCLDEDEAGRIATAEAARIVGYDKAKVARLPCKDPNEVLIKKGGTELLNCIFNATKYTPSGIISKEDIWEALEQYNKIESVPYPPCLSGLNDKLKGMRFGEIALFVSGTGSGKSSLIREIIYHILENTEDSVGIVALEESPAETARKLSSLVLNRNSAKEQIPLEELKVGFDKLFGGNRITLLDHQGAMSDNSILDQLEYMALVGCKYIFIDHITILVSEGVDGLTGNESQDKMMNELLKLVKRHSVYIGLVSHLRKTPNQSKSFEEGKLPSLDDVRGCLAYNTDVMLSNGHIEKVQNIRVNDFLMGNDGFPRRVLSLKRGREQMYKITMTSGDHFICNENHILTLSYDNVIFDISVKNFLEQSENFKYKCKQHYSDGYQLEEQNIEIPAYLFGTWLGDDSKSTFIVTKGEMLNKLKELGVYKNKHIPDCYKYNSMEVRLNLLAGLLDKNGHFSKKDGVFYFHHEDEKFANDIKDIARSLGFYSTIKAKIISTSEYSSNGSLVFTVTISGDINRIPSFKLQEVICSVDALKQGILIEKLDIQDYYGFTLDGNGRFLLGNHIITHNSGSVKQISMDVIGFARDMTAEDIRIRNQIRMSVLKCRHTGLTGPVNGCYYDYETGRLKESSQEFLSLDDLT